MDCSSSRILIDSCFPDSVEDLVLPDTLDLVVGEDYDTIPLLRKQAARSIVDRAMTEQKENVLQAFQPNSSEAYLPIIFGHCHFATEFVMLNLSYGSEAKVSVGAKILQVETEAGGQFTKNFGSEPVPEEKTLEIVRLLLKKNIEKMTVALDPCLIDIGKMSFYRFSDFFGMFLQTIAEEYEDKYETIALLTDLHYFFFVSTQPTVA